MQEQTNLFCSDVYWSIRETCTYSYRDYFTLIDPIPDHPCRLVRFGRLHFLGATKKWEIEEIHDHEHEYMGTYGLGKTAFTEIEQNSVDSEDTLLIPAGRMIRNEGPRGPGSGIECLLECHLPFEATQEDAAITKTEATNWINEQI